ncbi:MAG: adenylosuccinate synthetase, partial [Methanosarcinaceae archaeon]
KKSVYLNGYTNIALTKLDVLSNLYPIRICTGYEFNGTVVDYPPEMTSDLAQCTPVYEDMPGWDDDLTGVNGFNDLPVAAQDYVNLLEKMIGVPIGYVSVGPGRAQTFRN